MRILMALFIICTTCFAQEVVVVEKSGHSKNRLDLIFIGDHYLEDEMTNEIGHFPHDVDRVWNNLISNYQIYNRYKNFFNVTRIDYSLQIDYKTLSTNELSEQMFELCNELNASCDVVNVFVAQSPDRIEPYNTGMANPIKKISIQAPWATTFSHELGHILAQNADEYLSSHDAWSLGFFVNIASSREIALQKWGHWAGYADPWSGYFVSEPYMREGTDYYRPTSSDTIMQTSATGDFDAVSREHLILGIYDYVQPIDSYSISSDSISVQVVDEQVISTAWLVDGQIVSQSKQFNLNDYVLYNDSIVTLVAWDNCLNTDYSTDDRGGWIRKDDQNKTWQSVSWQVADLQETQYNFNLNNIIKLSNNKFFDDSIDIGHHGMDSGYGKWVNGEDYYPAPDSGENHGPPQITGQWIDHAHVGWIYLCSNGWVYHLGLGWMYVHTENDGAWCYFQDSWKWTSLEVYPYFYNYDTSTWEYSSQG